MSVPPVCSMFPPLYTSGVPVAILLVHTTSGVSSVMRVEALGTVDVMESDALTSAVLMPDTKSAPLSGSYSITAPSEKMPGSKKAVSSSPPMASNNTCSPTEGAHHTRERPAREVSQFNRPGHDTSLVEVDIGHNAGANEISKKT